MRRSGVHDTACYAQFPQNAILTLITVMAEKRAKSADDGLVMRVDWCV
jgi:hypothetical protein